MLSFVLVFVLSVSPHAAHANGTGNVTAVEQSLDEQPVASNPDGQQGILPLVLAPVAAYGITSTIVGSIFAASLGWYVGSSDLFKSTVYDKENTSSASYGIQYTPNSYDYFPDFAGFTIQTSATKHMEEALVAATADRIKNYGRNGNLRVFSSTRKPANVMAIIDITSSMGGTVNRHLGNYLSGKIGTYSNAAYKNEWMDLAGYSIFLISDKSSGQFFHAHFTPTRLVDQETEYQRYVGEFDVDYRQEIKIKKGDSVLLLLELADLDDRESDSAFLQFLSMIDGCFLPIGTALKLNRLELAAEFDDSEIVALTYLASFLLMSFAELVVGEEALMNAQPPVFLESWKRAFMHNPDKLIEFEGVRYLRSDSPASNHH